MTSTLRVIKLLVDVSWMYKKRMMVKMRSHVVWSYYCVDKENMQKLNNRVKWVECLPSMLHIEWTWVRIGTSTSLLMMGLVRSWTFVILLTDAEQNTKQNTHCVCKFLSLLFTRKECAALRYACLTFVEEYMARALIRRATPFFSVTVTQQQITKAAESNLVTINRVLTCFWNPN